MDCPLLTPAQDRQAILALAAKRKELADAIALDLGLPLPVSVKEEAALIRHHGRRNARLLGEYHALRNDLVAANLRFAWSVAAKFARRARRLARLEDLAQESLQALITAADTVDPAYGTKFITWAWHACRQRCVRLLLVETTGRTYAAAEARPSTVSLDADDLLLRDLRSDDVSPQHRLEAAEEAQSRRRRVRSLLASLEPRHRLVLALRFGVAGETEHSLADASKRLRVSQRRIVQIQANAIDKLRSRCVSSF